MHNKTDHLYFPGSAKTLRETYNISSFAVDPFNALLWSIYKARMNVLSAPDYPMKPWLAFRSYAGDGDKGDPVTGVGSDPVVGWVNTDFYQESVLHLALLGADDFLLFNPCYGTCTTNQKPGGPPMTLLSDNIVYSKIFTELTSIVGYKQRTWLKEPTPGGWLCGHVLSGMETPVSRVWRFTPADGKPHAHVKATSGGGVSVTTTHGDGSVATIVFEQAQVVVSPLPNVAAVSAAGVWINQSLAAAKPSNWQCAVN